MRASAAKLHKHLEQPKMCGTGPSDNHKGLSGPFLRTKVSGFEMMGGNGDSLPAIQQDPFRGG